MFLKCSKFKVLKKTPEMVVLKKLGWGSPQMIVISHHRSARLEVGPQLRYFYFLGILLYLYLWLVLCEPQINLIIFIYDFKCLILN